jgi:hypothetical protein
VIFLESTCYSLYPWYFRLIVYQVLYVSYLSLLIHQEHIISFSVWSTLSTALILEISASEL